LLVGDAAGTPDPITAGGLALAFSATWLAAEAIVSGDLTLYERRRLDMGRRAHRLGRAMLWLGRTQYRASWVMRHLSAVIPLMVGASTGSHRRMPIATPDSRLTTNDLRPTT